MAKILIVDDSLVQRTILKIHLIKEGHSVIAETGKGQNVLKLYNDTKPDIVLLDIVMPDANGIAILDQLMNEDPNAKVIMCSATAIQNIVLESIQLGAKHFLVKPITREKLLFTIHKTLEYTNEKALEYTKSIQNH